MRHPTSVLVIESDPALLGALAAELTRLEMQPVLAAGLDAALAALASGCAPDCIVIDVDRPRAGGRAAVARLHAHLDGGDVPVLALGSRAEELVGAGADAVMLKPLDGRVLRDRIAGICDCAPMQ